MYKNYIESKTYQTKYRLEFITITDDIKKIIQKTNIIDGTVTIQTHHTTCCIWINEDEKNLIGRNNKEFPGDLKRVLDRFAHPSEEYGHNDVNDINNPSGKRDTHLCEFNPDGTVSECINGHAHAHAMILPHTITLIIKNKQLILGKWQQILLVELDHDRERQISICVQGDDGN